MSPFSRCITLFCKVALLMVMAMSLSSCWPWDPKLEKYDPLIKEDAASLVSEAEGLRREVFDKIAVLRNIKSPEYKDYINFIDDVQVQVNEFLKKLAACKTQEEADELFKSFPMDALRAENDARKAALEEALQKSPALLALKKFTDRVRILRKKKADIHRRIQAFKDESGEDADAEGVEEVLSLLEEAENHLKSVEKALKGFKALSDGTLMQTTQYHDKVKRLLDTVTAAYNGWTPPPPAPFHPEKVLFTVETTPAMYESLLSTLLQQYKNYTFLYTASNGDRCVTDAKNTEGVVIHVVEPEQFDRATDSLDQGRSDLIFAFRSAYPNAAYEKLEEKDAESEDELNSILVSGVAHSALVLETTPNSAVEKLSTKEMASELNGTTIYTGNTGSLVAEMFDGLLKPLGVTAQTVDNPERQGMGSDTSLAVVSFNRTEPQGRVVRVARTPSLEKIYFMPIPGDIASGRYALSASVNVAFNPASQGNAEARKFVEFVLSEAGQSVVKSANFVSRDEYEEKDPELLHLKAMFEKAGYSIGRIVTFDTFLFPKNDTRIIKNPEVIDRRAEFKQFDSNVRSNFNHISQVLSKTTSDKGVIAVGIIGHASSEGGAAVNKPLSVNRAKYTGSCIKQKSGKMLILTDGMSSEVPVDDNKSEEGRVRNRRATAYVVEVYEVGTKK